MNLPGGGLRIGFAGTPEFAAVALRGLHAAGHALPLVLTQPDRPAGRGLKLQASPVKQAASALGSTIVQPRSLRLDGKYADDAAAARLALAGARLDALVVAAYGLILPQWVLDLPRLGCLNIHGSLLPRWRGAAPIQRAIEAGDARTGITIMQMDAGLDTGAMLRVESLSIEPDDTSATLYERLAPLGAQLVIASLADAARGALAPRPQPEDGVSYAHKISKDEAPIDWTLGAAALDARIRAFDPFPGATVAIAGQTLKCWRGVPVSAQGEPGQVLGLDEHGLLVACGDGALRLTQLQRAGGRRQPAHQALAGLPVRAGDSLA